MLARNNQNVKYLNLGHYNISSLYYLITLLYNIYFVMFTNDYLSRRHKENVQL